MRSLFCFVLLFVGPCYTTNAQFYCRGGLGYALPLPGALTIGGSYVNGTYVLTYSTNSLGNNYDESETLNVKKASFSADLSATFGVGYSLNRNISVELDAGTGLALRTYNYTEDVTNITSSGYSYQQHFQNAIHATNFTLLTPSVVFSNAFGKLNLYERLGCALPVATRTTVTASLSASNQSTQTSIFYQRSSFNTGVASAIGISYPVGQKLRLWCELNALSLSVTIKEEDIESHTGYSPTTMQQQFIFVTSGKLNALNATAVTKPAFDLPFSNVALGFGFSYRWQ